MYRTPEAMRGEEVASQIARRHGLRRAPIDPAAVLRELGAEVRFVPLKRDMAGVVARRGGRTVVGINESHHKFRQRFTLAHECGHLACGHLEAEAFPTTHVDTIVVKRRDSLASRGVDPMEIEANNFAAALLMPADLLRADLPGASLDAFDVADALVARLARKYQVSRLAMAYRLINLGLISPGDLPV